MRPNCWVAADAKIEKIRRGQWQEKLSDRPGYWICGKLKAALALQQDGALCGS